MAKPGRPSKGDRTVLWSRVPTEVADAIKAEAARRGLPYGDVCAEIRVQLAAVLQVRAVALVNDIPGI
jgi:hypothetical protein